MGLPTVTVVAQLADQSGAPISGARVVATLDRAEVHDGIVVPQRTSARSDDSGRAELALFPNDLGVAGSSYQVAAYDTGGRLLYQGRAVFPDSDDPLSLYAYVDNPTAAPVSITDQQMQDIRAARAGIDTARAEVADNADAVATAAQAVADDRTAVASLRSQTQAARDAVAQDKTATTQAAQTATTAAGNASDDATTAANAANSAATDAQQASADRAAATNAADRAENAADQLEQLITENNALRALVAIEHGRPLLRNGRAF